MWQLKWIVVASNRTSKKIFFEENILFRRRYIDVFNLREL